MKKYFTLILIVSAVLFTALTAFAQVNLSPVRVQNYVPTGACTLPNQEVVVSIGVGAGLYQCINSVWVQFAQGTSGNATTINNAAVPASATILSSNSSSQLTSTATTGIGSVVLATSPTLVTPALGAATATTLQVGTGTPLAGAVINATQSNVGTTTQINVQNTSSDAAASSDLVATADNGTNSTNFLDCGVNSSTYSVAGYNTGGADDGYCYATGNLNLAAAGGGKSVTINAGGTTTAQTIATFSASAVTLAQPLTVPAATGIAGVTGGTAASAGYIGQVLSSCIVRGSGTALTSASTINFLTLSLTAGDWDVEGNVNLVGTASTATNGNFTNSITTTSATSNTDGSEITAPTLALSSFTGYDTVTLPRKVVNVSVTTPTYLVVNFQGTITSGTGTLWGCITARRVH
jgi:hypothetical protein